MATNISNSMEQDFDWLDNFLEICEEIYPGKEGGGRSRDSALKDRFDCIYCGHSSVCKHL